MQDEFISSNLNSPNTILKCLLFLYWLWENVGLRIEALIFFFPSRKRRISKLEQDVRELKEDLRYLRRKIRKMLEKNKGKEVAGKKKK